MEKVETTSATNVLRFPQSAIQPPRMVPATPIIDALESESDRLNEISHYRSEFDWGPLRSLEVRNISSPVRFGFLMKTTLRLVNSNSSCQQCLYSFELDTYGRGCTFNCQYCYAREQLSGHGEWNAPYPVPINVNSVRKVFYRVFETEKKSKWRSILERRIPLGIGSMSDSFMGMDDRYRVTKEILRLLSHYNYPYIIFTRSDLIAKPDYVELLRKDLCSIQFSISSTNDELNRYVEPGAPSAKRRLRALETVAKAGFWTTVRINPLFPNFPDGYYTDPNFAWSGAVPSFDFSRVEMIDEIAATGTKSLLAGFIRLSPFALFSMKKALGVDLKPFFTKSRPEGVRDFHYDDKEIRHYYEMYRNRAAQNGLQFTTCYIGNGESQFWRDQDLWSNKTDCWVAQEIFCPSGCVNES